MRSQNRIKLKLLQLGGSLPVYTLMSVIKLFYAKIGIAVTLVYAIYSMFAIRSATKGSTR